jgi:ribosome-binding protein aMBF1 (putative translation factor)
MWPTTRNVRRGQNHPKATCSDHEVDLIRRMHECGWGYKKLAQKFEMPVSTIRDICKYRTR